MTTALGDPNTSETITAANGQVSKPFIVKKYDGTELFSIDKDGNAAVPLSSFVTAATVKAALGAASSGVDGYLSGSDFTTFASKAAGDHDHDSAYSASDHTHDYSSTFAALNHTHAYAASDHNHDSAYSATGHTHDYSSTFAALDHAHDLAYSALGHTHAYAASDHNHDAAYVAKNAAISGATKTKVTYDAKGLVTSGADIALTDLPSGTGFLKGAASTPSFVTFALTDIPSGTGFLKASSSTPTYQSLSDSDIPNLAASKITSGTFDEARVPSLAASKIATGQFVTACIPNLPSSIITSGTFDAARLPAPAASARGGVALPAESTGTYYKDDGTWGTPAGVGGVTNGDAHDHSGGDGAQIAYSSLSGTPTLGTAAALNSGVASGNVPTVGAAGLGNSQVVETTAAGLLISASKATGYNLATGTTAGTVATGDHNHTGVYAAASHAHAGDEITSGTIDGDVLPAMSTTKKGAVPASTTNTGSQVLYDNGWAAAPSGGVISSADYIITKESETYKCYSGATGAVVSSNAAASTVFQYAATALAASGGRIVVKPATYTFVTAVTLGSGTLIDAQGSVFDVTGLDDVVFSFGTDTAAGWQWSATSTAGEKQTGLINANFNGTITNSSTLAVRISQVNAGAIVENISTKRVYNVVEIRGACYGAVVRNVKGHYTAGTFIKLVAEYLTSVAYQPNDATIDHCEMSSFSETCIGVDNTTDGNGSSVPASGVTITRCWLESMHKCIRTEGSSMKISNCVLSTIATGTDHIAIEQTATAKFLIINGCSISSDNESGSLISIKAHYSVNNCTFNYFKCPAIVQENASGIYCQVTNNHFWPDGSATALTVISGKLQYSHICNNRFMSSNDVHTGISALSGSSLNVISGNIFSNLLVGLTGYSIISAITGNAFNGCPDGVIATNMGTDCTFTGNEFYSCAATISGHTPTPNDVGNMGYIVKKAGTATITNGQASITVTHGMTGTPTKVTATGSTADTNALYVDTVGTSQFTIHAAGNVGGNRTVYWYAEV